MTEQKLAIPKLSKSDTAPMDSPEYLRERVTQLEWEIEKLLDANLKRETKSEKIKESGIYSAWIECQKELENPKEKSRGNYANYAKLEDILKDCLPILNRHGFALTQTTHLEGSQAWMCTTLEYKTGDVLQSKIPIFGDFKDMMKFGAGLTYARRYSLCMLLGIEGEKDLDGDKITAEQIDDLYKISKEKEMPAGTASNLIEYAFGYSVPEDIDQFNFDRIRNLLLKWKPKTKVDG